jgi:hypothetical protein
LFLADVFLKKILLGSAENSMISAVAVHSGTLWTGFSAKFSFGEHPRNGNEKKFVMS